MSRAAVSILHGGIDVLEELMKLAEKRSSSWECYLAEIEETPVRSDEGKARVAEPSKRIHAGVRMVIAGRVGFAETDSPERPNDLIECAAIASEDGETADWLFPTPHPYPHPRIYDRAVQTMTPAEMCSMVQGGLDALRRLDTSGRYRAAFTRRLSRIAIANSSGVKADYEKTLVSVSYSAEWPHPGEALEVEAAHESCRAADPTAHLVGTMALRHSWARNLATIRPGKSQAVFTGRAFAQLARGLRAALNGHQADAGVSPFVGRLGQPLFDSALTVYDNPLMDWAPGSAPWDDEGTPCSRVPLINAGTLAGFCLDLKSAIHLGKRSTGSALRHGFSGAPVPGYHNIIIDPGSTSFDRIVQGVRYGLLVDCLRESPGDGVNGDFSLEVKTGFLIDRGEIVGRVTGVGVAGNLFELLRRVPALGDRLSWSRDGYYPDIRLDDVDIVTG